MKDSSSLLFLSLAVVLGLSVVVLGRPSQVAYNGNRDASHDAGNRRITDPHTLSVAASTVGDTYSNGGTVVDPLNFTDRLPEPLGMALIGAFLAFLGIALSRKHGPVRRD